MRHERGDLAPRQGDEGAPDAWLVLQPEMARAMAGLTEGAEVIVLTWLDRASWDVYQVHPRGEENRPAPVLDIKPVLSPLDQR